MAWRSEFQGENQVTDLNVAEGLARKGPEGVHAVECRQHEAFGENSFRKVMRTKVRPQ